VLEIGPGGGALTGELVATGAQVLAVELDPAWAFALQGRAIPGLALAVADAVEIAWERLPAPTLVAGNLPYAVGTAILERLLIGAAAAVPRAAFLLQREVVDRIIAQPGEAPYGALSVLVASRAEAVRLGRLPPGAFRPPPAVESAFVGLRLGSPYPGTEDLIGFLATLRAAFAQRRKTVRNSLASVWGRERSERVLAEARLDPAERAERLGLEAFAELHRAAAREAGC
jgi:16S rRNA (adenine1518-N6/adenine1519-N6)-dimethyltransferase